VYIAVLSLIMKGPFNTTFEIKEEKISYEIAAGIDAFYLNPLQL